MEFSRMSNGTSGDGRLSRNERREAAREQARTLREEQQKKDRRNRVYLFGGLGVVVIAIIAGVALIIGSAIKPAGPGPANMASGGLQVSQGQIATMNPALLADAALVPNPVNYADGVVDIQIYVDYLCPFCGQFEQTNSAQLKKWIASGAATVEIHPLAILDRSSMGSRYSTRSANAASCVANFSPNNFFDYSALLFTNQPKESTEGLPDSTLKDLVGQAGVTDTTAINACIDDTTFKNFVASATAAALRGPLPNSDVASVTGTPTVLVNGKQYSGSLTDATAFSAFVLQVGSEAAASSTSTPPPAS
jgi:protein-disulfide isomerase